MDQLTLPLELSLASEHRTLLECIASCIYAHGVSRVAGKIDLSPSHLSEALAGGGDRHRKFGVDDLEQYVQTTGDKTPILYLIAKYLGDPEARRADALSRLAAIADQVPGLLAAAGIKQSRARR